MSTTGDGKRKRMISKSKRCQGEKKRKPSKLEQKISRGIHLQEYRLTTGYTISAV